MKKISFFISAFLTIGFLSYSLVSDAADQSAEKEPPVIEKELSISKAITRPCSEFYTYSIPASGSLCSGMENGSIDGHDIASGYSCTFNATEFESSLEKPCLQGTTFSSRCSDMSYICYSEERINYFGSSAPVPKGISIMPHWPCVKGYKTDNRWTPDDYPSDSSPEYSNYGYSCHAINDEDSDGINENVCTAPGAVLASSGCEENCCALLEE